MAGLTPSYKMLVVGSGAGLVIAGIVLMMIFAPSFLFAPKYRIDIETVQTGLTIKFIKIKVANTGSEKLTNVNVQFGVGEKQNIGTLEPGKAVWLTPSESLPPFVRVTSDEGVDVTKSLNVNVPYAGSESP